MTSNAPKWKRLGFQTDAEYRAACSAKRKTQKASMLATKTENTAYHVLRVMWENAEFHAPTVTIIKEQIMSEAKCGLTVLKKAVAELRAEGSIIPIKGFKGGRGVPTTYKLAVAGQKLTPADGQIEAMQAERDRAATWRFLKNKYGPVKALEIIGNEDQ